MIRNAPSLLGPSRPTDHPVGLDAFVERYVEDYWYYGSGKAALRDGLRTIADGRGDVLLPAYVPDAVAEPIRDVGLEARYYAVRDDLGPDVADLDARLDEGTAAIVSVNYFGFPQPDLSAIARRADDGDRYHVDDNAHATVSVHDGRLLGTTGDLGFTSLWKTLPVPDGALLYVTSSELRDRFEPSPLAGVRERFDGRDVVYALRALARELLGSDGPVRRRFGALVEGYRGGPPAPRRRYESSKARMSNLSARTVAAVDPDTIRSRRRENYRAWLDVVADLPAVTPLFTSLPDGICPQSFPAYAEAPASLLDDLASHGVRDVHTWPRLPAEVDREPSFETASRLARHVVALPVHRRVEPDRIAAVGSEIVDAVGSEMGD